MADHLPTAEEFAAIVERDANSKHDELVICAEADRRSLLALVRAMRDYCEHDQKCVLTFFEQYDPSRGYKYWGKWMESPPPCECGLDALLAITEALQ